MADRSRRRAASGGLGHADSRHVAALAVVLLALMPLIGTGCSFSADEGAVTVQARSLSQWRRLDRRAPGPGGGSDRRELPLELSERGPDGIGPLRQAPAVRAAAGCRRPRGGRPGHGAPLPAGTVAAAGLAGTLARRLDPAIARPAIWVVGLASPLLFHGYLVIAHTWVRRWPPAGVLAAIVAFERRSGLPGPGRAPALAACVLLRSEGLFMAAALAAVAGVIRAGPAGRSTASPPWWPWSRRSPAPRPTCVENWWTLRLLGGGGGADPGRRRACVTGGVESAA